MAAAVVMSPWHEGELEAQRRAGIDPAYTAKVAPFLRPYLNEQHRDFYIELPFVIAGALDQAGRPWATLLQGDPGFLQAMDETRLHVDAEPDEDDPARPGFAAGRDVGLLGIQLETRRRNRLNGRITRDGDPGFDIVVDRAYGNCPKYITTHELQWTPPEPRPAERRDGLDDEARATITAAASFYIASHAGVERGGVDVSHRGGRPGFVAIDGDWLTVPDFQGNQFFNTLGNLLVDPRAGLLFVDFVSGDLLQVSGTAEVLYDSPLLARFAGAQRGFRVRVERLVRRRGALAWRGRPLEASPAVARTDTWAELRAREAAAGWRDAVVERVVDEAEDVRSFHLRPADPASPVHGVAGQHLVLRVPGEAGLVRSYSLSRLPREGGWRISVKKAGAGSGALHAALAQGGRVSLRGPLGDFAVDTDSPRSVVLVSAGIGITPMLAMAERLVDADAAAGRTRRIHLVHGARDGAAMPFRAELAALQARSHGLLRVVLAFSRPRPQDVQGADFEHPGRVDLALLRSVLPFDDYDFYLCGPAEFMQSLHDGLRRLDVPESRIRAEAFGPSSLRRGDEAAPPPVASATAAVPVRFARSGKQATWRPGDGPLLDLAAAQGLHPEHACRSGSCGTCRVRVDGAVAYPDGVAPPGAPGTALICVAMPAQGAPALTIDA